MWPKSLGEQGFAIICDALDDHDISSLEQSLASASIRRSKAGVRHALAHPAIAELANDSRLLDIARRVLGSHAFPFRATLFDKSPLSNWLVAWHQDTALPLREKREAPGWGPWSVKEGVTYSRAPALALGQVLALRIHLDDSAAGNGPLRVLPGTHTMGVLSNDAIRRLTSHVTSVVCIASKGSVLAMRPLLVHASSKSHSEMRRRVLHVEYASSRVTDDGLELAVA